MALVNPHGKEKKLKPLLLDRGRTGSREEKSGIAETDQDNIPRGG